MCPIPCHRDACARIAERAKQQERCGLYEKPSGRALVSILQQIVASKDNTSLAKKLPAAAGTHHAAMALQCVQTNNKNAVLPALISLYAKDDRERHIHKVMGSTSAFDSVASASSDDELCCLVAGKVVDHWW